MAENFSEFLFTYIYGYVRTYTHSNKHFETYIRTYICVCTFASSLTILIFPMVNRTAYEYRRLLLISIACQQLIVTEQRSNCRSMSLFERPKVHHHILVHNGIPRMCEFGCMCYHPLEGASKRL